MKRHFWLVFFAVPALAFGLVSDVAASEAGGEKGDGGHKFIAVLRGANEVPAIPLPGSDLVGTARITINKARTAVCWDLEYTTTQQVRAAHIHKGAAGVPGPIVFGFFNPPPSTVVVNEGCRSGSPTELAFIRDIANHPGDYYVNVHTTAHPGGAARGQLMKRSHDEDEDSAE